MSVEMTPVEEAGAEPAPAEVIEPLPFIPLDEALMSPERIEQEAEFIRSRVASKPADDGQVRTPDSIIRELDQLRYVAGLTPLVLRNAQKTRAAAARAAAKARAIASRRASGRDARSRELQVEVIAELQIAAAEDAQIAYDYAKSVAQVVRDSTSAVQTMAKQVEITFNLAKYEGRP